MKKNILHPGFIIGLLSGPIFAYAAPNLNYLNEFIAFFQDLILEPLLALLIATAVILFLWGMVVFMANADNETARQAGKSKMVWGIVILFVMISIWGFVSVLQEITGIEDATLQAPPLPD